MSTIVNVIGEVTLDSAAAKTILESELWEEYIEGDTHIGVASKSPKGVVLKFTGQDYKNIQGPLFSDLVKAQRSGSVEGNLTVLCEDGHIWVGAAVFKDGKCYYGEGDCFSKNINGSPATLENESRKARLIYNTDDASLLVFTGSKDEECCCGGFGPNGESICTNL